MRARNLKPGFFKNDILAECDPLARLLFQGLWCLADRKGRLYCRIRRIKAEVLPYDNCDLLKLLQQLVDRGFIIIYKIENEIYLEIPTFTEHQNPHIKEQESTIPAPCKSDTCTVLAVLNPESLLLNPESPLRRSRAKPVLKTDETFKTFWQEYPKKRNLGDAEKAWSNINFVDGLFEKILYKVETLKKTEDWKKENGKYIPYPATWLNRKGWEDEVNNPFPRQEKGLTDLDAWEKEIRG